MPSYEDELSLRDARERYFRANDFDAGGYTARWVKLQAGPLPLRFPNRPGRVRAVKLHDLHHVATGYDTSWTGEAEIGAWEIAAGCADHWWAWWLNLGAFAVGLVIAPRRTFRAFVRGRHGTSLYRAEGEFRDELLDWTVGELRQRLALQGPAPRATPADRARFALWVAITALCAFGLVWAGTFLID